MPSDFDREFAEEENWPEEYEGRTVSCGTVMWIIFAIMAISFVIMYMRNNQ